MRPTRLSAFALAVVVLGIVVAVAQASPFMPTQYTEASATNPIAACPPDGSGINFDDSEVEPWLDVNPTADTNLIAVYQQDRYSNGGAKVNVASTSFNGGLSWTQVALPETTRCSGNPAFERASDPWVSFGPTGVAHAMSLVTDPDAPSGAFGDNGMMYNRSKTGGASWEDAVLLTSDTGGRFLNDKNSMTADPNDADFVYAVWDRLQQTSGDIRGGENVRGLGFKGPVMFTRTTDGGDSWETPRRIYESGGNKQTIGNQIVVAPQSAGGSLYDFFGDITNGSRRRGTFGPLGVAFIRSDNKGTTWTKPRLVSTQVPMSLIRGDSVIDTEPVACPPPDQSKTGRCPIRAGDFIPDVAVNRSNGNLYAVWMDSFFRATSTSVPEWDSIAFSRSNNGGATWSEPIRVNQTPQGSVQNSQAFTPSVHVLNDGTIAVSYYDFRFNTPDPATLLTDHWVVHCHPTSENCANAANWDEETRVTPASFNIRTAPYARGYFLGDYVGLANAGGDILSLFGSTEGSGPSSIWLRRSTPAP
jgi:hypothetical protein